MHAEMVQILCSPCNYYWEMVPVNTYVTIKFLYYMLGGYIATKSSQFSSENSKATSHSPRWQLDIQCLSSIKASSNSFLSIRKFLAKSIPDPNFFFPQFKRINVLTAKFLFFPAYSFVIFKISKQMIQLHTLTDVPETMDIKLWWCLEKSIETGNWIFERVCMCSNHLISKIYHNLKGKSQWSHHIAHIPTKKPKLVKAKYLIRKYFVWDGQSMARVRSESIGIVTLNKILV